ncbi:MAG: zinc ribbon domain-containing protein [Candidatus Sulfotelmatobacter sp.]
MPTDSTSEPSTKVLLGCSRCGANLPDEARFCLQCGKPVGMPAKQAAQKSLPEAKSPEVRRKRRLAILWILLGILLLLLVWMAISDNPFAQQIQEMVGLKHDETIIETETPFLVGAHTFRYYKFALPEGSLNVAVVGQFSATSGGDKTKSKAANADNTIEVYVLSEPAFTVWQNGYATSSVYESGRVADGKLQADVPAGAGIYYLVFNNRFAPKTGKSVSASVWLRYKSWLPGWFRRVKGRVLNWFGF